MAESVPSVDVARLHAVRAWTAAWMVMVAVCTGAASVARADDPAGAPLADLHRLAVAGRFGDALSLLKSDPRALAQPDGAALLASLETYEKNEAGRRSARREQFDKALADAIARAADGKLDEALVLVVEAHGLADDPAALLADERVAPIVRTAEAAAEASERDGDYLESVTLLRTLSLLFERQDPYRDRVRTLDRRVRLLRLYATDELRRLYEARAKRMGRDKAPSLELEADGWKQELSEIDVSMLRQALRAAASQHIDNGGYGPMIAGGLEALRVLSDMPRLVGSFPALGEAQRVKAFGNGLDSVARRLPAQPTHLDATAALDRLLELNQQTLRLPEAVLVAEFADGAFGTLDDFSTVIWPSEVAAFRRHTQGTFFGVGIQIAKRDGRLLCVSPLPGTPALRAGVKAGDVIAKVDGRDTTTWSLDQAVREITGPEGSVVTLGLERQGVVGLIELPIRRAEIVIESIRGWRLLPDGKWDYWVDPRSRIGYIRLSQFIPQTADDLDAAINQMEQQVSGGPRALILDLRFDPGGLLTSAVDVADRFLRSGVIVSTVGPDGKPTDEPARARADKTYRQFPVVVLINQGSASASEIVSGALQDWGRATIVGERSFGKGSVQEVFRISAGKALLKLTTQYYKLPGGRIIHRKPRAEAWGIDPDLSVKMTAQEVADMLQLRQDLDVLRDPDDPAPTAAAAEPPAEPGDGRAARPKVGEKVEDFLAKGLDRQLEAAVLVLQSQLVAEQATAVARTGRPVSTP